MGAYSTFALGDSTRLAARQSSSQAEEGQVRTGRKGAGVRLEAHRRRRRSCPHAPPPRTPAQTGTASTGGCRRPCSAPPWLPAAPVHALSPDGPPLSSCTPQPSHAQSTPPSWTRSRSTRAHRAERRRPVERSGSRGKQRQRYFEMAALLLLCSSSGQRTLLVAVHAPAGHRRIWWVAQHRGQTPKTRARPPPSCSPGAYPWRAIKRSGARALDGHGSAQREVLKETVQAEATSVAE